MRDLELMRTSEFPAPICSVARSLEIVGEWWTLLVIREAFFGTRRFSDFETRLGIAKNVLGDRLAKLVAAGVMARKPVAGRGNPMHYTLTPMGRDLLPVIIALMQWGDRWIYGPDRAPVRVLERATGREIAPMRVNSDAGQPLAPREMVLVPGPGADETVPRRIGEIGDVA
jgi:DNA-binding HxlR family transcriptional regulator